MKLYFRENSDLCTSIEGHLSYMKENDIKEMQVFEAKVEHGTGFFFCHFFGEVGEVNGTCGKMCKAYQPRNGKSGCCKNYGFVYEQTEKSKILKLKQ